MDIIEKIANTLHTIFYELTGGDIDRDDWTEDGCLPNHYCFRKAKEILAVIKETGYVKLVDDQSLPEIPMSLRDYDGYERCKEDMVKAGWRKVEVKGGS